MEQDSEFILINVRTGEKLTFTHPLEVSRWTRDHHMRDAIEIDEKGRFVPVYKNENESWRLYDSHTIQEA